MKYALVIATVAALTTPALADDVGVRVGPVGAGVTVGEGHDRDRDHDRTTVVKEREPRDRTTTATAARPSFITITTNLQSSGPTGSEL
jgi:hypothetical protein